MAMACPAVAQDMTPFMDSTIPFMYDRGRNIGVLDRTRPEYEAAGMPAGAFTIYPQMTLGAGFTDNVYQTETGGKSDAVFAIDPRVSVQSNLTRRSLSLSGGANFVRYADAVAKNQNGWDVEFSGTQDFAVDSSLVIQAHSAQRYENLYSGDTLGNLQSAVPYHDTGANLRTDFHLNRMRLVAQGDFTRYSFGDVVTLSGVNIDQANRNRDVYRGTGQTELAVSPNVSLFAQLAYDRSVYDIELSPGVPNRSSEGYRILAGVSFDLTALARGSIGIGYIRRDYDSALYANVAGLSVESKVEWFPSGLTTVTLSVRRLIQDSAASGSSAYFDTGADLRIDHELLRNLLINANFDFERDDYEGIISKANVYRFGAGAHYLMNRGIGISGTISYGKRTDSGVIVGQLFSELTGMLSITMQR